MKKKLSAMCLVISLFITMFPVSAKAAVNQDGYIGPIETPESDAVKISTAEDLDNIRDDLSGSYVLVSDIDLSSYSDWSPIGATTGGAFRGTLDGQGHTITGLHVSEIFTSATLLAPHYAVGLFGVCDGAVIKNLTLENVDVSVITTSGYGYTSSPLGNRYTVFAGGLAGFMTGDAEIYNCYTSGTVLAEAYEEGYSDAIAGGIVGYMDTCKITYSGSSCDVKGYNNNSVVAQDSMAGGLVGAVCSDGVIDRCYNTGTVNALTGNYGVAYAGGLLGYSEATSARITNSFNEGAVTAMSGAFSGNCFCDDAYAGGIAATCAGLIDRTYNSGTVHAQGNDDYGINSETAYVGGICAGAADTAVISNCAIVQPSVSASAGQTFQYRIARGGTKTNNATVSQVTSGSQNDADTVVSVESSKVQALYETTLGWDFGSVWEMVSGKDFPQLKQGAAGSENYFQWSLEGGLLLISGDGPMPNWSSPQEVPWHDRASEITGVRITDGITTVGDDAFFWCRNLETVTLSSNLERIGTGAFLMCEKLETLDIPDKVTEIGVMAFADSGLTSVVFRGAAPEIRMNAWENVRASVGYYSDKGGWEETAGENYGGFLTWVDLYLQENSLIDVSAVKLKYGKKEGSVFSDKSLPGVPSTTVSQYAEEFYRWARKYGYDKVLTESACKKIVREYMPTVVYAEDGVALVEDQYKTWEIMRDVLMLNSAKDSINQWENEYLKDAEVIHLTEAQEQLSRIISVYASYVKETERNPVANAVYNIFALPLVQDAGKQVWKVTKEYVTCDISSDLRAGDFSSIVESAMSVRAAWKEDGIDSIIASGQVAGEDILEELKENFVKDLAKTEAKKLIGSVVDLNPTLAELRNLSDEITAYTGSFKTYSLIAEFAPAILFEVELIKLGKLILDTMDQVKEAQFFMIQYDTLRNHREIYDTIIREDGAPIDVVSLELLMASGEVSLSDFQMELLNTWYGKGGQQLVEPEQRIALTSLASTAVTLQNMTPAAMQEKIVAYWAARVEETMAADAAYQVQYTLPAENSFQVLNDQGISLASYTPDSGYVPAAALAEGETGPQADAVYVSLDETGTYVTVSILDTAYQLRVEMPASFVLVDVLTQANTSYSAFYEGTQADTNFSLQDRAILARAADGGTVAPTASCPEEESIASLDAAGLQIQYQDADSADCVTGDLALPQTGDLGSTITWSSSNEAAVDSSGAVTRGEDDREVVLTATVTMGDASAARTFPIVVAGRRITVTLVDLDSGDVIGQIETTAGSTLTMEEMAGAVPEGTEITGCFYDARQRYPYYENQAISHSIVLYVTTRTESGEESWLTITQQPEGATYETGETAQALTVGYSASEPVTFQWYQAASADLRDGAAIDGATEASYVPSTAAAGTAYYYVVLTAGGRSVASSGAAIVVTEKETALSGTFGTLTWALDAGYNLVISGTGGMPESAEVPWDAYKEEIASVRIEDGVTSVSAGALTGLTNAAQITVADSVTSVAAGAFAGCSALEKLQVPFVGLSRNASGENGVLGAIFGKVASGGTVQHFALSGDQLSGYCYDIPDSLREITVTDAGGISFGAFYNCAMVTDITLNEGITAIAQYSFRNCTGLTELTLPDSVVTVEEAALNGCTALKKLTIPFVGAGRGGSGTYDAVFGILFGRGDSSGVLQYGMRSGTSLSGYYYDIPAGLTEVAVTDETVIPLGAFSNCANLTKISLSDTVTTLELYAFYNCTGLTGLEIPASVTELDDRCLTGCTELTVYCCTGTAAHTFCQDNGIPYVLLDARPDEYAVTVIGGNGSGNYAEGAAVTITAYPPAGGKRFKAWSGAEGLTFTSGDASAATATFTMPAEAVTVTAIYEDMLTAWLDSQGLHYKTALPENTAADLIAARYDTSGRMLGVSIIGNVGGSGVLGVSATDRCRVFLVQQKTLVPLTPVWDSGAETA